MSRSREQTDVLGHGSFLDVVTNMVGILIILVMILGMRIKNAPVNLPPDAELQAATADLASDQSAEQAMREDVQRLTGQIRGVARTLELKQAERAQVLALSTAVEQKIEQARKSLGAASQKDFQTQKQIDDARDELEKLQQEEACLVAAGGPSIEIKSYPTPIGRTVNGQEFHFQLRGGRIAPVPVEECVEQVVSDAKEKMYKLRDDHEITETIGPISGFRVRYTLARHDLSEQEVVTTRRTGAVVQLMKYELLPVSQQLGETIDEALAPNSEFRNALARARPGVATVTLWTYPDSFAEYRRLHEELYRMNLATAGRPLPDNLYIGGSPEGSKSSAQ